MDVALLGGHNELKVAIAIEVIHQDLRVGLLPKIYPLDAARGAVDDVHEAIEAGNNNGERIS